MTLLYFLRSLLFTLFYFPILTVVLSLSGSLNYIMTGRRTHLDWCAVTWADLTLKGLQVQLKIIGQENIPQGGCLFLFNHTSFVDIFALTAIVRSIKFGAKVELFSIPFFGQALKAAGVLPITRNNRENAIRTLTEAESRAKNGEKFALSPEGGRNFEEKLLPFKSGPFIFAIKSGVPIAPVIIHGANQVWRKKSLLPSWKQGSFEVSVEFLKPEPVNEFTVETRANLVEKVRRKMLEHFPEAN